MCDYTRREILRILYLSLPISLLGCRINKDAFDEERVCVHVFNKGISIPEPLIKGYDNIPARTVGNKLFEVGIPELLICKTTFSCLDMFQYFWPVTREEFKRLHGSLTVKFERSLITKKEDIEDFSRYLDGQPGSLRSESTKSVVILTLNNYTKYWSSRIITSWQNAGVEELVIFKDPAKAPYLCSFPSVQKGFKRPPPI